MRIDTLSVFPQVFSGSFSAVDTSIVGRARQKGLLELYNHDLRDFTHDRHRTTDDEPYGGGQGLLMKVEPVFEALDSLNLNPETSEVVVLSPAGRRFDQTQARELSRLQRLVLVCGHYEGFDERVYTRADRIISIGDFILTGGELAAMCIIDAVCRLLPDVLGDERSAIDESFNDNLLEYPQYTRPADYRGLSVPAVLLSGNHALIAKWRREQSIIKTATKRPDLLAAAYRNGMLDAYEQDLVRQLLGEADLGC